jgi:1,4-alpha-glucan branching enzyme
MTPKQLQMNVEKIVSAKHGDPFSFLGMHAERNGALAVRAFLPNGAKRVHVIEAQTGNVLAELPRIHGDGLFAGPIGRSGDRFPYRLRVETAKGAADMEDPYRFPPVLGEMDVYLIAEGKHLRLDEKLGAHPMTMDGVAGVGFAVWAPNATRVSIVGDFNGWDGRRHPMRFRAECGVWEMFLPGAGEGFLYKYEIASKKGDLMAL